MAGGFGVEIQVDFDKAKLMAQMQAFMQIFYPASFALFLETVAHPIILKRAQDRFAREGDDASGKWGALSDVTARFREWQGVPGYHPINKRTGNLESWLMSANPDVDMTMSGAEYIWPGDMPNSDLTTEKFETAQLGKSKPATEARPVVAANVNDLRLIYDALGLWLNDEISKVVI